MDQHDERRKSPGDAEGGQSAGAPHALGVGREGGLDASQMSSEQLASYLEGLEAESCGAAGGTHRGASAGHPRAGRGLTSAGVNSPGGAAAVSGEEARPPSQRTEREMEEYLAQLKAEGQGSLSLGSGSIHSGSRGGHSRGESRKSSRREKTPKSPEGGRAAGAGTPLGGSYPDRGVPPPGTPAAEIAEASGVPVREGDVAKAVAEAAPPPQEVEVEVEEVGRGEADPQGVEGQEEQEEEEAVQAAAPQGPDGGEGEEEVVVVAEEEGQEAQAAAPEAQEMEGRQEEEEEVVPQDGGEGEEVEEEAVQAEAGRVEGGAGKEEGEGQAAAEAVHSAQEAGGEKGEEEAEVSPEGVEGEGECSLYGFAAAAPMEPSPVADVFPEPAALPAAGGAQHGVARVPERQSVPSDYDDDSYHTRSTTPDQELPSPTQHRVQQQEGCMPAEEAQPAGVASPGLGHSDAGVRSVEPDTEPEGVVQGQAEEAAPQPLGDRRSSRNSSSAAPTSDSSTRKVPPLPEGFSYGEEDSDADGEEGLGAGPAAPHTGGLEDAPPQQPLPHASPGSPAGDAGVLSDEVPARGSEGAGSRSSTPHQQQQETQEGHRSAASSPAGDGCATAAPAHGSPDGEAGSHSSTPQHQQEQEQQDIQKEEQRSQASGASSPACDSVTSDEVPAHDNPVGEGSRSSTPPQQQETQEGHRSAASSPAGDGCATVSAVPAQGSPDSEAGSHSSTPQQQRDQKEEQRSQASGASSPAGEVAFSADLPEGLHDLAATIAAADVFNEQDSQRLLLQLDSDTELLRAGIAQADALLPRGSSRPSSCSSASTCSSQGQVSRIRIMQKKQVCERELRKKDQQAAEVHDKHALFLQRQEAQEGVTSGGDDGDGGSVTASTPVFTPLRREGSFRPPPPARRPSFATAAPERKRSAMAVMEAAHSTPQRPITPPLGEAREAPRRVSVVLPGGPSSCHDLRQHSSLRKNQRSPCISPAEEAQVQQAAKEKKERHTEAVQAQADKAKEHREEEAKLMDRIQSLEKARLKAMACEHIEGNEPVSPTSPASRGSALSSELECLLHDLRDHHTALCTRNAAKMSVLEAHTAELCLSPEEEALCRSYEARRILEESRARAAAAPVHTPHESVSPQVQKDRLLAERRRSAQEKDIRSKLDDIDDRIQRVESEGEVCGLDGLKHEREALAGELQSVAERADPRAQSQLRTMERIRQRRHSLPAVQERTDSGGSLDRIRRTFSLGKGITQALATGRRSSLQPAPEGGADSLTRSQQYHLYLSASCKMRTLKQVEFHRQHEHDVLALELARVQQTLPELRDMLQQHRDTASESAYWHRRLSEAEDIVNKLDTKRESLESRITRERDTLCALTKLEESVVMTGRRRNSLLAITAQSADVQKWDADRLDTVLGLLGQLHEQDPSQPINEELVARLHTACKPPIDTSDAGPADDEASPTSSPMRERGRVSPKQRPPPKNPVPPNGPPARRSSIRRMRAAYQKPSAKTPPEKAPPRAQQQRKPREGKPAVPAAGKPKPKPPKAPAAAPLSPASIASPPCPLSDDSSAAGSDSDSGYSESGAGAAEGAKPPATPASSSSSATSSPSGPSTPHAEAQPQPPAPQSLAAHVARYVRVEEGAEGQVPLADTLQQAFGGVPWWAAGLWDCSVNLPASLALARLRLPARAPCPPLPEVLSSGMAEFIRFAGTQQGELVQRGKGAAARLRTEGLSEELRFLKWVKEGLDTRRAASEQQGDLGDAGQAPQKEAHPIRRGDTVHIKYSSDNLSRLCLGTIEGKLRGLVRYIGHVGEVVDVRCDTEKDGGQGSDVLRPEGGASDVGLDSTDDEVAAPVRALCPARGRERERELLVAFRQPGVVAPAASLCREWVPEGVCERVVSLRQSSAGSVARASQASTEASSAAVWEPSCEASPTYLHLLVKAFRHDVFEAALREVTHSLAKVVALRSNIDFFFAAPQGGLSDKPEVPPLPQNLLVHVASRGTRAVLSGRCVSPCLDSFAADHDVLLSETAITPDSRAGTPTPSGYMADRHCPTEVGRMLGCLRVVDEIVVDSLNAIRQFMPRDRTQHEAMLVEFATLFSDAESEPTHTTGRQHIVSALTPPDVPHAVALRSAHIGAAEAVAAMRSICEVVHCSRCVVAVPPPLGHDAEDSSISRHVKINSLMSMVGNFDLTEKRLARTATSESKNDLESGLNDVSQRCKALVNSHHLAAVKRKAGREGLNPLSDMRRIVPYSPAGDPFRTFPPLMDTYLDSLRSYPAGSQRAVDLGGRSLLPPNTNVTGKEFLKLEASARQTPRKRVTRRAITHTPRQEGGVVGLLGDDTFLHSSSPQAAVCDLLPKARTAPPVSLGAGLTLKRPPAGPPWRSADPAAGTLPAHPLSALTEMFKVFQRKQCFEGTA